MNTWENCRCSAVIKNLDDARVIHNLHVWPVQKSNGSWRTTLGYKLTQVVILIALWYQMWYHNYGKSLHPLFSSYWISKNFQFNKRIEKINSPSIGPCDWSSWQGDKWREVVLYLGLWAFSGLLLVILVPLKHTR